MKHVVLLLVDPVSSTCLVSKAQPWALSFSYKELGRAHKSSSKQAAQIASRLCREGVDPILCGHLEGGVLVYAIPWSHDSPSKLLAWRTVSQIVDRQLSLMCSLAVAITATLWHGNEDGPTARALTLPGSMCGPAAEQL